MVILFEFYHDLLLQRLSARQNKTMSQPFPVIVACVNSLAPATGLALCQSSFCEVFEIAELHYEQPEAGLTAV